MSAAGLEAHNRERATMGVGPLSWNTDLAVASTAFSELLASQNCRFEHSKHSERPSPTGGYADGENLYLMMSSGDIPDSQGTLVDAVGAWINEHKPSYVYNNYKYNHYTQVMWRGSTEVGCGRAVGMKADGTRCAIVTCRYREGGNIMTMYPW